MSTKLATLARLVLRPAQWDANAEGWSRLIPCDSPGDLSAKLREEVNAGRARVCHLKRDGAKIGFVVFSADDRHELVIHGAFGSDGKNLVTELLPVVENLARQCECDTIRFHTMRPGLVRAAQNLGFRVSEVIMRKAVCRG
jgi:hypothetical protein